MGDGIFGNLYNPIGSGIGAYQLGGGGNVSSPSASAISQNLANLDGGGGIFGNIFNSDTLQGISQGLGAFQSLASIYGMFQNLGLQKKAFKFAREGTKRNFNAQATAFNNAVASKETARRAYAAANNQDYNSMYAYGTGEKVEKWT